MELRIAHLYPDLMNTYGDMGNIIALTKRCMWRNIAVTTTNISVGDTIDPEYYDLYFFGGGQDWQQGVVAEDLKSKSQAMHTAKANKAVFLSICGGYQLLGHYYKAFDGSKILGIGLIDCHTQASHRRMINNLVVQLNIAVVQGGTLNNIENQGRTLSGFEANIAIGQRLGPTLGVDTLVGFENHWGQTFLGNDAKPLGTVIIGNGNNGEDGTEGAVDGTAFGCYLHGSLLPKNPHFADYLIKLALIRRHANAKLLELDDSTEINAHRFALKRAQQVK